MLRRLYDWVIRLAAHPRALAALGLISFLESSVFPIPPDVMLIPMVLADRTRAFRIALVCTVCSVLAAEAVGADLAYIGTRFTASKEANASEGNKQCIIDSTGEEIVYTNLFTGVHGNYLKRSIAAAGLDPDDLPEADKSKMNFGSGGNSKAKAWRDIWGAGQGVGQIFDAPPAAEIVARLKAEYAAARAALFAGETVPTRLKQAAE